MKARVLAGRLFKNCAKCHVYKIFHKMDSVPLGSIRISIIFYQTATHKVALSFEPVKTSTFFS